MLVAKLFTFIYSYRFPMHWLPHHHRLVSHKLNEHDMAMNHWRSALKFDPEHSEVKQLYRQLKSLEKHQSRGEAASAAGQHEDAIGHWKAAIAVDASHKAFIAPTSLKVAKAYMQLKKWAEAIDACQESINQQAGNDATFEAELMLGEVGNVRLTYNYLLLLCYE